MKKCFMSDKNPLANVLNTNLTIKSDFKKKGKQCLI